MAVRWKIVAAPITLMKCSGSLPGSSSPRRVPPATRSRNQPTSGPAIVDRTEGSRGARRRPRAGSVAPPWVAGRRSRSRLRARGRAARRRGPRPGAPARRRRRLLQHRGVEPALVGEVVEDRRPPDPDVARDVLERRRRSRDRRSGARRPPGWRRASPCRCRAVARAGSTSGRRSRAGGLRGGSLNALFTYSTVRSRQARISPVRPGRIEPLDPFAASIRRNASAGPRDRASPRGGRRAEAEPPHVDRGAPPGGRAARRRPRR